MAIDFQQVVAALGTESFTYGELQFAFDCVAPAQDWKAPINAVATLQSERAKLGMHLAVEFFTGSRPTLEHLSGNAYRVVAAGYYATVGA